jgi:thioesterase domain-containing protein
MQSTKKGLSQKISRWLHISTFMLITLAPIINKVLPRLLDKQEESHQARVSDKPFHKLTHRGKQVKKKLAKQKKGTWTVLGFGLGLTVASAVTFQLVRQGLRRQEREANETNRVRPVTILPA